MDARVAPGSLVVAAATPRGAIVMTANDRPETGANAFGMEQFEARGAATSSSAA